MWLSGNPFCVCARARTHARAPFSLSRRPVCVVRCRYTSHRHYQDINCGKQTFKPWGRKKQKMAKAMSELHALQAGAGITVTLVPASEPGPDATDLRVPIAKEATRVLRRRSARAAAAAAANA